MTKNMTLRRAICSGLVAMAISTALASPAGAEDAPTDSMNDVERAALLSRPSLVYLETEYQAWMTHPNGYEFNNGNPYTLRLRCSGFVVSPDGYVVTAGHCVDENEVIGAFVEAGVEEGLRDGWVRPSQAEATFQLGLKQWIISGPTGGSSPIRSVSVQFGVGVAGLESGQATAGRVVDVVPFDEGDVALLKIEATDLPTATLAELADVSIGTSILSIGYPGAADLVTDATYEPTFRDGHVASQKTRSNGKLPVWEISADVQGGMSGGPTVDLDGNVIGVNSFGVRDEDDAYVSPAPLVHELLARNGVENAPGPIDKAYRAGVDALAAGDASAAIEHFDEVLDRRPSHQQAQELRARGVATRGSDPQHEPEATAPAEEPARDVPASDRGEGTSPLPFAAGGVLVAGAAAAAVHARRNRTAQRQTVDELRRELDQLHRERVSSNGVHTTV